MVQAVSYSRERRKMREGGRSRERKKREREREIDKPRGEARVTEVAVFCGSD